VLRLPEPKLSLARIKNNTDRHTLFVALDAGSDRAVITLRQVARSIGSSFRLPKNVAAA
jgi:hypothetical protein